MLILEKFVSLHREYSHTTKFIKIMDNLNFDLTLTERDILFCALHEYVLVLETYCIDARALKTRDLISKLSVLL